MEGRVVPDLSEKLGWQSTEYVAMLLKRRTDVSRLVDSFASFVRRTGRKRGREGLTSTAARLSGVIAMACCWERKGWRTMAKDSRVSCDGVVPAPSEDWGAEGRRSGLLRR
jgi:hypothetical protein